MTDLRGKRVWITGASSGIGAALASALSEEGANLILSARREELLEQVKASCQRPDDHHVVPLDLSDSSTLATIAQDVITRFGPIDILINNGGISQRSSVVDTALHVDRRLMEVNFFGALALTKAALPAMLEQNSGHIVVISSVMGKLATPLRSGYAASKHALQGYFDCLRAEVHNQGVHVTLVCPGYVNTQITRHALTADGSQNDSLEENQRSAMSPQLFAKQCLQAIKSNQDEILIGGKEIWVARLRPFFPRFFNRMVRKVDITGKS